MCKIVTLQSEDCTVFFFTVAETYKPIGFIETASPVVSMEWSNEPKVIGDIERFSIECRNSQSEERKIPLRANEKSK